MNLDGVVLPGQPLKSGAVSHRVRVGLMFAYRTNAKFRTVNQQSQQYWPQLSSQQQMNALQGLLNMIKDTIANLSIQQLINETSRRSQLTADQKREEDRQLGVDATISNVQPTTIDKTALEARIKLLEDERAETLRTIEALSVTAADALKQIAAAQHRFDVLGDDSAKAEIDRLRAMRDEALLQATRKRPTLDEYPSRINAIRLEIEQAVHRENLRTLPGLKEAEKAAYFEYEQAALAMGHAYLAFRRARANREGLHSTIQRFAQANRLTGPDSGYFEYPYPEAWWSEPSMIQTLETAFANARRGIK